MKRDVVFRLLIGSAFIIGVLIREPWVAAPAAFLMLLDTLESR